VAGEAAAMAEERREYIIVATRYATIPQKEVRERFIPFGRSPGGYLVSYM
jgi:hypothetical protein